MGEYVDTKSIGGSDVGTLMGLNKYATPQDVYNRLIDPAPHHGTLSDDNMNLRRGTLMEPIICDEYTRITGRQVAELERKFHPKYPYVHVSIDRVIVTSEHKDAERLPQDGPGVLETKCHNAYVFKEAKEEGLNPSYYAQLQHGLWVHGWLWGGFGLFWADGWELHEFDVQRDNAFIDRIENTVCEFYYKNVLARNPPDGKHGDPVVIDPKLRGQSQEYVKRDDGKWLAAVAKLKIAQEAFDLAEAALENNKKIVQGLMGDDKKVAGGGAKCQWVGSSAVSLDKDGLTRDYPLINLEKYTKRKSYEKFLTTWEKQRG